MNKRLNIVLIVLLNFILVPIRGQNLDFVKILPGHGIVFNDDSIKLFKTTVNDLCRILKIKDKQGPNELTIRNWDGFDPKTREEISGTDYYKEIKYKSIIFQFLDSTDSKNLTLNWIQIKEDKSIKAYTDNGLELGAINPKINQIYPKTGQWDYFSRDSLTYNFYTYGISLSLVRLQNNNLRLIEISTHYKNK